MKRMMNVKEGKVSGVLLLPSLQFNKFCTTPQLLSSLLLKDVITQNSLFLFYLVVVVLVMCVGQNRKEMVENEWNQNGELFMLN